MWGETCRYKATKALKIKTDYKDIFKNTKTNINLRNTEWVGMHGALNDS